MIYIAGPMTGLVDHNYPAFNVAESRLAAAGMQVLNPARIDNQGHLQSWDWYMRRTIRMLTRANKVALLPGWEASLGATLEHEIASQLSLEIRPLAGWLA